jgi:hypothetical protein
MLRRAALGVLGLLAALALGAAVAPAAAAPDGQTGVPAAPAAGMAPALSPVVGAAEPAPVLMHTDDMCPVSAIAYPSGL